MTAPFASVNGHHVTALTLYVPNRGAWFADCELDDAPSLSGPVTCQFGALTLSGTVSPSSSGAYGATGKVRVVAGGGGWGRELAPRAYHNDAGVRALNVATDSAREAGEKIGAFTPGVERLGADYVRRSGPASVSLEDVAGGVPWWVGFDGVTNVAQRPAKSLSTGSVDLLSYDPQSQIATLAVDDPTKIQIGHQLVDERLDGTKTIRELEFVMSGEAFRVTAWCGGDGATAGRLERLFEAIVERIIAEKLFGKYLYRVFSMAPDGRVNLQAIEQIRGLPDMLPVSQKPGIAGWHSELVPGAQLLVEFIAGDARRPIISGYAGKGEANATPVFVSFGEGTAAAARVGSMVDVLIPAPIAFTGTINGAPATGVLATFDTQAMGIVQDGNSKVLI